MLLPVLDWSLSSDNSLNVESEHGEHSKSSVLDLLNLELSEGIWVVSKSKRVEALTRVKLVKTFSGWATVHSVGLGESHEDNLASQDSDDGLGVDQGWVSEVVKSAVSEDEGTLLEPWVRGHSVSGELWADAAEGSEHGPPGVDELGLPVGGEGLRVGGESSRVPAVVTRVLTLQVGWAGVVGVWSCKIERKHMSSQYTKSTKSRRRREEEDYERKRLTKPLSSVWSIPHAGSGDNTGSLGGLGGL